MTATIRPSTCSSALPSGVIHRYRDFLPVTATTPVITLAEGGTPLIHSPKLSRLLGADCEVYLKFEGLNPTGSFKDRGMTVAISKAVEGGAKLAICASTGNTSASAAAYAARAGIACVVLLPHGKIAPGKLAQAYVHGAIVIEVDGNFDDCFRLVRELAREPGVALVNSINPDRIAGQKTAAFEVVDALGDAPEFHLLPVGNAGNITAYWRGYREYRQVGRCSKLPRMMGFQAAGAAPIFYDRVVPRPETAASAIRIGNPASWQGALGAIRESGGAIDIVSDQQILHAQRWLAAEEGIFVEPASAASVAGLLRCASAERCERCPFHQLPPGATSVVCTVTGHGLKDVTTALSAGFTSHPAPANKEAILTLVEKYYR
ncbi:MAG: threonine synthase [Verrucomicrobia bacterium]|nr:threonine synthase [Verrucomicrobiota bacterium]